MPAGGKHENPYFRQKPIFFKKNDFFCQKIDFFNIFSLLFTIFIKKVQCGAPWDPGALGPRGPGVWNPGALGPWDPGTGSLGTPGTQGPGSLGTPGAWESWDQRTNPENHNGTYSDLTQARRKP